MVNRLLFYAAPTELGLNLSAEDYKQVAPNAAFDLPLCSALSTEPSHLI